MQENPITDRKGQIWLIGIVSAATFMITLDYNSLNVSLPVIAKSLGVKVGLAAWLPLIYLLVITSTLLGFGKLGDTQGYKRVFRWGLWVFAAGGLFCAVAPSFTILLAARAFQSLGQAMYSPICIALLTAFLPSNSRGKALGLLATFQGLGLAAGPVVGGFINSHFNWRGNFLLTVPLCLAILFAATKTLPESERKNDGRRFDLTGAFLLGVTLVALIYGVNSGTKEGWSSPWILASLGAAVAALILFLWQEKRADDPLLDLKLFRNPHFTFAAASSFIGLAMYIGIIFLFPFYLQMMRGLDISRVGLILMVPSLLMMIVAPFAGTLSDRFGSRPLCALGMVICIISFVLLSFLDQDSSQGFIVLALLFLGAGMGLFLAPNNKLVMAQAPQDRQGVASGVYKIALNAGSSIGIALYMLVLAQVVLLDVARTHLLLAEVRNHPEIMMDGFRGAFILGIFLGTLNLVLTLLSRDRKEPPGPAGVPQPEG